MKDSYGDKIEIEASLAFSEVSVMFTVDDDDMEMLLTANKARKFARKLNQAASAIEIRTRQNAPA